MQTDGTVSTEDTPGDASLPDAFRALNAQRIDIDQRMMMLPADDPARDVLWQELSPLLAQLRTTVKQLAASPASHLPELRAKADVLTTLLRLALSPNGPIIPEHEQAALSLSLAEDIARYNGG